MTSTTHVSHARLAGNPLQEVPVLFGGLHAESDETFQQAIIFVSLDPKAEDIRNGDAYPIINSVQVGALRAEVQCASRLPWKSLTSKYSIIAVRSGTIPSWNPRCKK